MAGTFYQQIGANKRNSVLLALARRPSSWARSACSSAGRSPGTRGRPSRRSPSRSASGWSRRCSRTTPATRSCWACRAPRRSIPRPLPQLYNVVQEMAIAANVPMPKIYLIDDTAPNAFATGRDPQHASVAITTGLLQKLDREELQGVMAHELVARPELRHPVLADGRRAGRVDRAAGRLLPAVHVLGRRTAVAGATTPTAAVAGCRSSSSWSRSCWPSSPRSSPGSSSSRSAASASTWPTRRASS